MFHEKILVDECKKNNPIAQKELYDKYADVIMAICYRYTQNMTVAEDLMQDSLIKILTRVNKFQWINQGSLNAWVKKVTVNTCLTYLGENKKGKLVELNEDYSVAQDLQSYETTGQPIHNNSTDTGNMELINEAELSRDEMLKALSEVPELFRIVFNLHVIEGFKHDEISKMLHINTRTSKTRLFRARKALKELIYKMSIEKINKNK